MRFQLAFVLAVIVACVGAGCANIPPPTIQIPSPQGKTAAESTLSRATWTSVDQDVDRLEVSFSEAGANGRVILYRLLPDAFDWQFAFSTSSRVVSEWAKNEASSSLVMNGVYFNEDAMPSGFLISRGVRYGSRHFDLDKSGIIDLSPSVRVIDTARSPVQLSSFTDAAQSYPFLIKEGKGALTRDTGHAAPRSFIGTDAQGRVILGVVVGSPVSLYRFMTLLQEQPVEWKDALNLDGGPSTGLVTHFAQKQETLDSLFPVSSVLVVRKRN